MRLTFWIKSTMCQIIIMNIPRQSSLPLHLLSDKRNLADEHLFAQCISPETNSFILGSGYNKFMCCCCSVIQSCPLCHVMDCSMPGLSVPHHLSRFAQVHVHCIGDAIQSSYPLMPSSPSVFNLFQHQGLFQ